MPAKQWFGIPVHVQTKRLDNHTLAFKDNQNNGWPGFVG